MSVFDGFKFGIGFTLGCIIVTSTASLAVPSVVKGIFEER